LLKAIRTNSKGNPMTLDDHSHGSRPGSAGEHELQARYGTSSRALAFYNNQMLDFLNPLMREFIARQELVFIATADSRGDCDASIRAGLPGFVRVLDERTLIYPEYRGNGVMASLGNILENPRIGMLFPDFQVTTVGLHVNGKASILENDVVGASKVMTKSLQTDARMGDGRKPERWVQVHVEEAYIHCSKHIPLFEKLDKTIHWGTDNVAHKGGDFFKAKRDALAFRSRTATGDRPELDPAPAPDVAQPSLGGDAVNPPLRSEE
jgi:predicted pyridoxine 5'-phosphate oxidase superfamily flavin-nucleotide-binding protein